MPVLDLGDVADPKARYFALIQIYAVMARPHDAMRRQRYMVAAMVDYFREANPIHRDTYEAEPWWRLFDEIGAWQVVYDSLNGDRIGDEIVNTIPRWHAVVGAQLRLISLIQELHTDCDQPWGISGSSAYGDFNAT